MGVHNWEKRNLAARCLESPFCAEYISGTGSVCETHGGGGFANDFSGKTLGTDDYLSSGILQGDILSGERKRPGGGKGKRRGNAVRRKE